MNNKLILPCKGLGDKNAQLRVYIGNQPDYTFNRSVNTANDHVCDLEPGEIYLAGEACGNGWRKVFNVYAKFVFALSSAQLGDFSPYTKWQDYRDKQLLQEKSKTALLFTPPDFNDQYVTTNTLHIVMGKTYAKSLLHGNMLGNIDNMIWLNSEFAINTKLSVVICPYFDYRQLSNVKILYLVDLIQSRFAWGKIHT